MNMTNREALLKAADAIDVMADAHKEMASAYRTMAESSAADEVLRPMVEGAARFMEALGNSLDAHDCCGDDDELEEKVNSTFDMIHEFLGAKE